MKATLFAAALAAWMSPAIAADVASGTFTSRDVTMQVKSAMAFKGTSIIDKKDVIVVPITNATMNVDALAEYYDRRRAVDRRIKDNDTGVVYLEFQPNGSYRALSYYFASGNGCGYCQGGVDSTVKLANGRLSGTLKSSEENRKFDVTIDIPVMSDDHGAALPADGGAPAKAYLAYHAALVKRDAKALAPLLTQDSRDVLAKAEKDKKAAGYMNYLSGEHPGQSVQVDRGWSKGNVAILLISGESTAGKVQGEVMLRDEAGSWRVDDELTDLVLK